MCWSDLLSGTSGDTGGSAIHSTKGLPGLDVLVVYPRGRISAVQEKHMITCLEDNVHVFSGRPSSLVHRWSSETLGDSSGLVSVPAADGTSDDIDQPIRRLFADQNLVSSHGLVSLNSVNWSRVMVQVAHFLYAYLELSGVGEAEGGADLPELEVVVPTGGAGNITGGSGSN